MTIYSGSFKDNAAIPGLYSLNPVLAAACKHHD